MQFDDGTNWTWKLTYEITLVIAIWLSFEAFMVLILRGII